MHTNRKDGTLSYECKQFSMIIGIHFPKSCYTFARRELSSKKPYLTPL